MGKGRAPCCDKSKVRTGPWSPAEDLRLMHFIQKHGHSNWRALPKQSGLLRCGKSCRLRWINYLRPDLKRGNFTPEEEQTIIDLHNSFGNKWSKIASCLPGRTDNEIKNVWNTHLKKRLQTGKSSVNNCNKTEAKHSMDYSSSSSCISSSITSGFQDRRKDHEPKETTAFASPSSSSVSSFSNKPNEALEYPKPYATNPHYNSDNENIIIPSDFDIDFWELLDSLDPLFQATSRTEHNGTTSPNHVTSLPENIDVDSRKVEFSKSLRYLEKELGLTSDCDQALMNLDQEIISNAWDYSPWSPHNLGI